MPEHSKQSAALHRRDVLKAAPGLAASAFVPAALKTTQAEAATSSTLVVAAPATPQSLDSNFDVSLGTFEAVAALYDNLLEFKKIPDPKVPGAFREDIADHPNMPAGLAIQGKLAQSFELDPAGRFIRFQLRPGVKSNWGNELTADDVKWTWDRKFGLKAIGAFYLSTLGLEKPEGVKVEGKYTVSINLDHPEPAARQAAAQPLRTDLRQQEVQGGGDRRRSVGAQVHREQLSRLRSLSPRAAAAGSAGGVQGAPGLLPRQAGDGDGNLPRSADIGHACLAAAGRCGRYRAVSAAAGDRASCATSSRASRSTASTHPS